MDEADGPAVEDGELGGGAVRGGEVAVDPLGRAEARDGDAVGSEDRQDARLQGVKGEPGGVFRQQHLAVVEGDGRLGPGEPPQARSRSSGRLAHQLGAEVGVLLAAGLEVGADEHAHAPLPVAGQAEGVARPGRVGAAVGVQQADSQRLGAGRETLLEGRSP